MFYHCWRDAGGTHFEVVSRGYRTQLPHVVRHSPTGMNWGYQGSGAADLARSILIHYFRQRIPDLTASEAQYLAEPLYQDFKVRFIARARKSLIINRSEIDRWLSEHPEGPSFEKIAIIALRRTAETADA